MKISEFRETLIKNGGISLNLITDELNPKEGYFVSLPNKENIFNLSDLSDIVIMGYICDNLDQLLNKNAKYFLGGWIDKDRVYLDVSIQLFEPQEAILLGIKNQQKAIFDAYEQKVIYLTK